MRLNRSCAAPEEEEEEEEEEDIIPLLGLSPLEPTRAASPLLVHRTARAAVGRLVPTRIRS